MEFLIRRGFLYPSFEIYGGVAGFYDYGPLGAMLKHEIEETWRKFYCYREGYLEIHCPTISPEKVFIASGHVKSFVDPIVKCKKCGQTYRADHLIENQLDVSVAGNSLEEMTKIIREKKIRCPSCGGELGEVSAYNLMFKTSIGPEGKKIGYLRPETAQGMFILFPRLYQFFRKKLPFGVAQIGKAYRNEIAPRQGLIRLREFTQAEVEIFVNPENKEHKKFEKIKNYKVKLLPRNRDEEIYISLYQAIKDKILPHTMLAYQIFLVENFLVEVGIKKNKIRFRQHKLNEMAHYASDCWDAEVFTNRYGWIEVVGIADRTDYDLKSHEKYSGIELNAFIEFKKPKKIKKVYIEPNLKKLGPKYRNRIKEIIEEIEKIPKEKIEEFKRKKILKIKDIELKDDEIIIKEKEEVIHGKKVTPHVIEPSFGIDRIVYCILEHNYIERNGRKVLSLRPKISPIKFAVFPLVEKHEILELAEDIFEKLKYLGYPCIFDSKDSIGRRYARVDEIGVPFSITIDFDSISKESVTIRERDSMRQVRVKIEKLSTILKRLIEEEINFDSLT